MEQLLPDRLMGLWQLVDRREITEEAFTAEQERLLAAYRQTWAEALRLPGHPDLEESLLTELGRYVDCADSSELRSRCQQALADENRDWGDHVDRHHRASVERFYDDSRGAVYYLTWWHTLTDDLSPLAYVLALDYAKRQHCKSCLDFGTGVGSGTILFARHGFEVAVADISSPLLEFCRWRMSQRGLPAAYFDLKTAQLPHEGFDMITAMDVFEHLVDPVATAEELWRALRPGGFLFGRFGAESNPDRPTHIVEDFGPTFARLQDLGCVETWRDQWLWGHQVFQKRHDQR